MVGPPNEQIIRRYWEAHAPHHLASATSPSGRLDTQLRVYRISAGHLEDFVRAWTSGVRPLRRAFGFESEAWADVGADRFVWLLRYQGPGTFAEADGLYYASPERLALDPDPAQWIVGNETYDLVELTTRT